jgi:hypothetical protein
MSEILIARASEVVAIFALFIAAGWLFRQVDANSSRSLSHHGGTTRRSYRVFAAVLSLHAVVFGWVCLVWLVPHFQLGRRFIVVAGIALLTQLLTAWIRDGINPVLHRLHVAVAYTMALTMPILLLLILYRHPTLVSASFITVTLVCMAVTWFVFLLLPRSRRFYLVYQSSYIIGFLISIMSLCVLG